MAASVWTQSLEWRIAWRHLRVGDAPPRWVAWLVAAALFLMAVGTAFSWYALVSLAPPPVSASPPLLAEGGLTREQQAYATLGGLTAFCGSMLLVFGLLARFFNLLATVITFSVLLGCMALVVVLSLMSGLEGVLRDQILAQRAHMLVSQEDGHRFADYDPVVEAIAEGPGIAGASPYLQGEIMVRSHLNRQGALLIGIVPERLVTVSNIDQLVREGSFDSLTHPESIPELDGLAFTREETPHRLRHLDAEGERSLRPRPAPLLLEEQGEAAPSPDLDLPPPPELPPPSLPLPDPGALLAPPSAPPAADGWEDPVEALGLGPPDPPPPPGDDEGWEDPESVLGLPPAGDPPPGPAQEASDGPRIVLGEGAVLDPILIGRELALELAVHVGADVQLITPVGRMTPAGRFPGTLAARVGGVFFSGMYEYDRKNVYAPLARVQAFLHSGHRVSGIEVKLDDAESLEAGRATVEGILAGLGRSDLRVQTWQELNRNLFSAMFLEKIAMFVALLFVVLVASFGILASNLMSVLEKSKEIAILKAMGSSDLSIQRVFVAEGLCVGILGSAAGIVLGLACCYALDNFGLPLNENVYYMEQLPVVVNPFEVMLVGVAALLIVWMSSLYPARVASAMRPVEGLRHTD